MKESVLLEINKLTDTLEKNAMNTQNIADVYMSWYNIVKDNKNDSFKKFRWIKPCWNYSLSALWSNLCATDTEWLRCVSKSEKNILKSACVRSRKIV